MVLKNNVKFKYLKTIYNNVKHVGGTIESHSILAYFLKFYLSIVFSVLAELRVIHYLVAALLVCCYNSSHGLQNIMSTC